MFIGQLGAAFAAKAIAPRISLGTLFVAAMTLEILGPLEDAPVLVIVAPLAIGVGYQILTRQVEGAVIVAGCTLAYAITALLPAPVDVTLFAIGALLYLWRTEGTDRFGSLGGWFLAAVIVAARSSGWTFGVVGAAAFTALATWIDRHRERRPATLRAAPSPCRPEHPPEAEWDLPAEAAADPWPSPLP
jgi:hypothetical protein